MTETLFQYSFKLYQNYSYATNFLINLSKPTLTENSLLYYVFIFLIILETRISTSLTHSACHPELNLSNKLALTSKA